MRLRSISPVRLRSASAVRTRSFSPAGAVLLALCLATPPASFADDCNNNGIPDDQELEANDCNANSVPDECDVRDRLIGSSGPAAFELVLENGATTWFWGLGVHPFTRVEGLAFDPNTSTLYGADVTFNLFIAIDVGSSPAMTIQQLDSSGVHGLAFDRNTNTLYGSNVFSQRLITINAATGTTSIVGDLSPHFVHGLAFDPNSNTLYGTGSGKLFTIDTVTGATKLVGPLGYSAYGLAFDANSSTLYGLNVVTGGLLAIDTSTGRGTFIQRFDVTGMGGLTFLPGGGADCNGSLVPDSCELDNNDCNHNDVPDDCELRNNDCNADLLPDTCQLVENDCNSNSTPDDCETDCNENGIIEELNL